MGFLIYNSQNHFKILMFKNQKINTGFSSQFFVYHLEKFYNRVVKGMRDLDR
jgi:hypothetical protein